MNILKVVFLFVSIWFTLININLSVCKNDIPVANIVIQAIGIAGFLTLQFDLL